MSKKRRRTDEELLKEYCESVDTSDIDHLIDPNDVPGVKKRKIRSKYFSDEALDEARALTPEELAALPEPWTKRGKMLRDDELIIRGTIDKNRLAARIFVTGEVLEDYIGEFAASYLVSINEVYYENHAGYEPLFIETRENTIRMTRFDPMFVWRCFHPDILIDLVQEEVNRLGVNMDPWKMEYYDFYQNMITAIKETAHGEAVAMVKGNSLDDFYHGIYLSCLLLFGKPGYMDVSVVEHYAQKEAADFLRSAEVYHLNDIAQAKLETLRKDYGSIKHLTNPEMHFVIDLYERAIKGSAE